VLRGESWEVTTNVRCPREVKKSRPSQGQSLDSIDKTTQPLRSQTLRLLLGLQPRGVSGHRLSNKPKQPIIEQPVKAQAIEAQLSQVSQTECQGQGDTLRGSRSSRRRMITDN
jgi:hypothetical protein